MRVVRGFFAFWYEFIVGDDWRIAAGLLAALALVGLAVHEEISAWWFLPLAVVLLLGDSLRRAARQAP